MWPILDFHTVATTGTFSARTRAFPAAPFRVSGTAEVPAGNYQLCVIGAGTTLTANELNVAILPITSPVVSGTVATAFALDANALSERRPRVQITVDREN